MSLALRKQDAVLTAGAPWFAVLLFAFSQDRLLGPLATATPDTIRGISAIPVLQLQAAFQHVARIELTWNLTRTNPLCVRRRRPLSAAPHSVESGDTERSPSPVEGAALEMP